MNFHAVVPYCGAVGCQNKDEENNNKRGTLCAHSVLNNAPRMRVHVAAQTVRAVFRKGAGSRRGPVWPFEQAVCGCGPRTASSTFP